MFGSWTPHFTLYYKSQGYQMVVNYIKKTCLLENDIILFPINLLCHWILVAVDTKARLIYEIDSLGNTYPKVKNNLWYYLCTYYQENSYQENELKKSDWAYCDSKACQAPQQLNSSDCRVFVCMAAKCLITNMHFSSFDESKANSARELIFLQLTEKLSVDVIKEPVDFITDHNVYDGINNYDCNEDNIYLQLYAADSKSGINKFNSSGLFANAADDELSWGRVDYLQYYPKLSRPTDEHSIFNRIFIRNTMKKLEPLLRQLYTGENISVFDCDQYCNIVHKIGIQQENYWPIDLPDMVKLNCQLPHIKKLIVRGLESDVKKKPVSYFGNFNNFVIIPEILTSLIMEKYNMKYKEAVKYYTEQTLPQ